MFVDWLDGGSCGFKMSRRDAGRRARTAGSAGKFGHIHAGLDRLPIRVLLQMDIGKEISSVQACRLHNHTRYTRLRHAGKPSPSFEKFYNDYIRVWDGY